MKVYQTITDLVGRTPLLEVTKIEAEEQTGAKIFAKLEASILPEALRTELQSL